MANVKVAVRIRPICKREEDAKAAVIVNEYQENVLGVINPKIESVETGGHHRDRIKHFSFDYCYFSTDRNSPNYASQQLIFNDLGTDLLDASFDGYNVCLFAYGQTGSGKTYTMMGDEADQGIIPRICESLLDRLTSCDEDVTSKVEVSFLEIYNERVRDLLAPPNNAKYSLKVREHPKDGPYVQDLSHHLVSDYEQVLSLMHAGNLQRTTAATHMHELSSRSHAIFTITFIQAKMAHGMPSEIVSKINLVDLAGSERASINSSKDRLQEGANINKSLVTLGNCIQALGEEMLEAARDSTLAAASMESLPLSEEWDPTQTAPSFGGSTPRRRNNYVPYRNSVLTWLLKDSLGGNSKTIMIATISPASIHFNETMSTLRYARRAKHIVNQPIVNEDRNVRLIRELRAEIDRLRMLLNSASLASSQASLIQDQTICRMLQENEQRVDQLTEAWVEKWKDTARIMQECNVGIRKESVGVIVESELPHLIGMDDDLLSTGIILYHLKEGQTRIGREDAEIRQDIVLYGPDIEEEQAVITNTAGRVILTPHKGAKCAVNGLELSRPVELTQGAVVLLGSTNMFRFNHPAEAARLRERRASQIPGRVLRRYCKKSITLHVPNPGDALSAEFGKRFSLAMSADGSWSAETNLKKTPMCSSFSDLSSEFSPIMMFNPGLELERRHKLEAEKLEDTRKQLAELEARRLKAEAEQEEQETRMRRSYRDHEERIQEQRELIEKLRREHQEAMDQAHQELELMKTRISCQKKTGKEELEGELTQLRELLSSRSDLCKIPKVVLDGGSTSEDLSGLDIARKRVALLELTQQQSQRRALAALVRRQATLEVQERTAQLILKHEEQKLQDFETDQRLLDNETPDQSPEKEPCVNGNGNREDSSTENVSSELPASGRGSPVGNSDPETATSNHKDSPVHESKHEHPRSAHAETQSAEQKDQSNSPHRNSGRTNTRTKKVDAPKAKIRNREDQLKNENHPRNIGSSRSPSPSKTSRSNSPCKSSRSSSPANSTSSRKSCSRPSTGGVFSRLYPQPTAKFEYLRKKSPPRYEEHNPHPERFRDSPELIRRERSPIKNGPINLKDRTRDRNSLDKHARTGSMPSNPLPDRTKEGLHERSRSASPAVSKSPKPITRPKKSPAASAHPENEKTGNRAKSKQKERECVPTSAHPQTERTGNRAKTKQKEKECSPTGKGNPLQGQSPRTTRTTPAKSTPSSLNTRPAKDPSNEKFLQSPMRFGSKKRTDSRSPSPSKNMSQTPSPRKPLKRPASKRGNKEPESPSPRRKLARSPVVKPKNWPSLENLPKSTPKSDAFYVPLTSKQLRHELKKHASEQDPETLQEDGGPSASGPEQPKSPYRKKSISVMRLDCIEGVPVSVSPGEALCEIEVRAVSPSDNEDAEYSSSESLVDSIEQGILLRQSGELRKDSDHEDGPRIVDMTSADEDEFWAIPVSSEDIVSASSDDMGDDEDDIALNLDFADRKQSSDTLGSMNSSDELEGDEPYQGQTEHNGMCEAAASNDTHDPSESARSPVQDGLQGHDEQPTEGSADNYREEAAPNNDSIPNDTMPGQRNDLEKTSKEDVDPTHTSTDVKDREVSSNKDASPNEEMPDQHIDSVENVLKSACDPASDLEGEEISPSTEGSSTEEIQEQTCAVENMLEDDRDPTNLSANVSDGEAAPHNDASPNENVAEARNKPDDMFGGSLSPTRVPADVNGKDAEPERDVSPYEVPDGRNDVEEMECETDPPHSSEILKVDAVEMVAELQDPSMCDNNFTLPQNAPEILVVDAPNVPVSQTDNLQVLEDRSPVTLGAEGVLENLPQEAEARLAHDSVSDEALSPIVHSQCYTCHRDDCPCYPIDPNSPSARLEEVSDDNGKEHIPAVDDLSSDPDLHQSGNYEPMSDLTPAPSKQNDASDTSHPQVSEERGPVAFEAISSKDLPDPTVHDEQEKLEPKGDHELQQDLSPIAHSPRFTCHPVDFNSSDAVLDNFDDAHGNENPTTVDDTASDQDGNDELALDTPHEPVAQSDALETSHPQVSEERGPVALGDKRGIGLPDSMEQNELDDLIPKDGLELQNDFSPIEHPPYFTCHGDDCTCYPVDLTSSDALLEEGDRNNGNENLPADDQPASNIAGNEPEISHEPADQSDTSDSSHPQVSEERGPMALQANRGEGLPNPTIHNEQDKLQRAGNENLTTVDDSASDQDGNDEPALDNPHEPVKQSDTVETSHPQVSEERGPVDAGDKSGEGLLDPAYCDEQDEPQPKDDPDLQEDLSPLAHSPCFTCHRDNSTCYDVDFNSSDVILENFDDANGNEILPAVNHPASDPGRSDEPVEDLPHEPVKQSDPVETSHPQVSEERGPVDLGDKRGTGLPDSTEHNEHDDLIPKDGPELQNDFSPIEHPPCFTCHRDDCTCYPADSISCEAVPEIVREGSGNESVEAITPQSEICKQPDVSKDLFDNERDRYDMPPNAEPCNPADLDVDFGQADRVDQSKTTTSSPQKSDNNRQDNHINSPESELWKESDEGSELLQSGESLHPDDIHGDPEQDEETADSCEVSTVLDLSADKDNFNSKLVPSSNVMETTAPDSTPIETCTMEQEPVEPFSQSKAENDDAIEEVAEDSNESSRTWTQDDDMIGPDVIEDGVHVVPVESVADVDQEEGEEEGVSKNIPESRKITCEAINVDDEPVKDDLEEGTMSLASEATSAIGSEGDPHLQQEFKPYHHNEVMSKSSIQQSDNQLPNDDGQQSCIPDIRVEPPTCKEESLDENREEPANLPMPDETNLPKYQVVLDELNMVQYPVIVSIPILEEDENLSSEESESEFESEEGTSPESSDAGEGGQSDPEEDEANLVHDDKCDLLPVGDEYEVDPLQCKLTDEQKAELDKLMDDKKLTKNDESTSVISGPTIPNHGQIEEEQQSLSDLSIATDSGCPSDGNGQQCSPDAETAQLPSGAQDKFEYNKSPKSPDEDSEVAQENTLQRMPPSNSVTNDPSANTRKEDPIANGPVQLLNCELDEETPCGEHQDASKPYSNAVVVEPYISDADFAVTRASPVPFSDDDDAGEDAKRSRSPVSYSSSSSSDYRFEEEETLSDFLEDVSEVEDEDGAMSDDVSAFRSEKNRDSMQRPKVYPVNRKPGKGEVDACRQAEQLADTKSPLQKTLPPATYKSLFNAESPLKRNTSNKSMANQSIPDESLFYQSAVDTSLYHTAIESPTSHNKTRKADHPESYIPWEKGDLIAYSTPWGSPAGTPVGKSVERPNHGGDVQSLDSHKDDDQAKDDNMDETPCGNVDHHGDQSDHHPPTPAIADEQRVHLFTADDMKDLHAGQENGLIEDGSVCDGDINTDTKPDLKNGEVQEEHGASYFCPRIPPDQSYTLYNLPTIQEEDTVTECSESGGTNSTLHSDSAQNSREASPIPEEMTSHQEVYHPENLYGDDESLTPSSDPSPITGDNTDSSTAIESLPQVDDVPTQICEDSSSTYERTYCGMVADTDGRKIQSDCPALEIGSPQTSPRKRNDVFSRLYPQNAPKFEYKRKSAASVIPKEKLQINVSPRIKRKERKSEIKWNTENDESTPGVNNAVLDCGTPDETIESLENEQPVGDEMVEISSGAVNVDAKHKDPLSEDSNENNKHNLPNEADGAIEQPTEAAVDVMPIKDLSDWSPEKYQDAPESQTVDKLKPFLGKDYAIASAKLTMFMRMFGLSVESTDSSDSADSLRMHKDKGLVDRIVGDGVGYDPSVCRAESHSTSLSESPRSLDEAGGEEDQKDESSLVSDVAVDGDSSIRELRSRSTTASDADVISGGDDPITDSGHSLSLHKSREELRTGDSNGGITYPQAGLTAFANQREACVTRTMELAYPRDGISSALERLATSPRCTSKPSNNVQIEQGTSSLPGSVKNASKEIPPEQTTPKKSPKELPTDRNHNHDVELVQDFDDHEDVEKALKSLPIKSDLHGASMPCVQTEYLELSSEEDVHVAEAPVVADKESGAARHRSPVPVHLEVYPDTLDSMKTVSEVIYKSNVQLEETSVHSLLSSPHFALSNSNHDDEQLGEMSDVILESDKVSNINNEQRLPLVYHGEVEKPLDRPSGHEDISLLQTPITESIHVDKVQLPEVSISLLLQKTCTKANEANESITDNVQDHTESVTDATTAVWDDKSSDKFLPSFVISEVCTKDPICLPEQPLPVILSRLKNIEIPTEDVSSQGDSHSSKAVNPEKHIPTKVTPSDDQKECADPIIKIEQCSVGPTIRDESTQGKVDHDVTQPKMQTVSTSPIPISEVFHQRPVKTDRTSANLQQSKGNEDEYHEDKPLNSLDGLSYLDRHDSLPVSVGTNQQHQCVQNMIDDEPRNDERHDRKILFVAEPILTRVSVPLDDEPIKWHLLSADHDADLSTGPVQMHTSPVAIVVDKSAQCVDVMHIEGPSGSELSHEITNSVHSFKPITPSPRLVNPATSEETEPFEVEKLDSAKENRLLESDSCSTSPSQTSAQIESTPKDSQGHKETQANILQGTTALQVPTLPSVDQLNLLYSPLLSSRSTDDELAQIFAAAKQKAAVMQHFNTVGTNTSPGLEAANRSIVDAATLTDDSFNDSQINTSCGTDELPSVTVQTSPFQEETGTPSNDNLFKETPGNTQAIEAEEPDQETPKVHHDAKTSPCFDHTLPKTTVASSPFDVESRSIGTSPVDEPSCNDQSGQDWITIGRFSSPGKADEVNISSHSIHQESQTELAPASPTRSSSSSSSSSSGHGTFGPWRRASEVLDELSEDMNTEELELFAALIPKKRLSAQKVEKVKELAAKLRNTKEAVVEIPLKTEKPIENDSPQHQANICDDGTYDLSPQPEGTEQAPKHVDAHDVDLTLSPLTLSETGTREWTPLLLEQRPGDEVLQHKEPRQSNDEEGPVAAHDIPSVSNHSWSMSPPLVSAIEQNVHRPEFESPKDDMIFDRKPTPPAKLSVETDLTKGSPSMGSSSQNAWHSMPFQPAWDDHLNRNNNSSTDYSEDDICSSKMIPDSGNNGPICSDNTKASHDDVDGKKNKGKKPEKATLSAFSDVSFDSELDFPVTANGQQDKKQGNTKSKKGPKATLSTFSDVSFDSELDFPVDAADKTTKSSFPGGDNLKNGPTHASTQSLDSDLFGDSMEPELLALGVDTDDSKIGSGSLILSSSGNLLNNASQTSPDVEEPLEVNEEESCNGPSQEEKDDADDEEDKINDAESFRIAMPPISPSKLDWLLAESESEPEVNYIPLSRNPENDPILLPGFKQNITEAPFVIEKQPSEVILQDITGDLQPQHDEIEAYPVKFAMDYEEKESKTPNSRADPTGSRYGQAPGRPSQNQAAPGGGILLPGHRQGNLDRTGSSLGESSGIYSLASEIPNQHHLKTPNGSVDSLLNAVSTDEERDIQQLQSEYERLLQPRSSSVPFGEVSQAVYAHPPNVYVGESNPPPQNGDGRRTSDSGSSSDADGFVCGHYSQSLDRRDISIELLEARVMHGIGETDALLKFLDDDMPMESWKTQKSTSEQPHEDHESSKKTTPKKQSPATQGKKSPRFYLRKSPSIPPSPSSSQSPLPGTPPPLQRMPTPPSYELYPKRSPNEQVKPKEHMKPSEHLKFLKQVRENVVKATTSPTSPDPVSPSPRPSPDLVSRPVVPATRPRTSSSFITERDDLELFLKELREARRLSQSEIAKAEEELHPSRRKYSVGDDNAGGDTRGLSAQGVGEQWPARVKPHRPDEVIIDREIASLRSAAAVLGPSSSPYTPTRPGHPDQGDKEMEEEEGSPSKPAYYMLYDQPIHQNVAPRSQPRPQSQYGYSLYDEGSRSPSPLSRTYPPNPSTQPGSVPPNMMSHTPGVNGSFQYQQYAPVKTTRTSLPGPARSKMTPLQGSGTYLSTPHYRHAASDREGDTMRTYRGAQGSRVKMSPARSGLRNRKHHSGKTYQELPTVKESKLVWSRPECQLVAESAMQTFITELTPCGRFDPSKDKQPEEEGGWRFETKERDIVLLSKDHKPTNPINSYAGIGIIKAPARTVFNYLKDPANRQLYDPMLKEVKLKKDFGGDLQVIYMVFKTDQCLLQQPRDCLCVIRTLEMGDRFLIVASSIKHPRIPPRKTAVRAEILLAGFCVQPLLSSVDTEHCRITHLSRVDLQGELQPKLVNTLSSRLPLCIADLRSFIQLGDA